MSEEKNYYFGIDCPIGKVQVENCITYSERRNENGYKPSDSAWLEIYIDGIRFRIYVGNLHYGKALRRGIHICGPLDMQIEKTSLNACTVWSERSKP